MSEESAAKPSPKTDTDSNRAELEALLRSAQDKSREIENILSETENRRAEIDALFTAAKEAVLALNQQCDAAKAASTQSNEANNQIGTILGSLKATLDSATENGVRIEALKVQVDQAATVAAQRSQHIEEGKEYVDKKRAEADVILNTAKKSATDAEAQHQAARSSAENLNTVYTAAQTTKVNTESNAADVAKLLQQCQEYAVTSKKLADIAATTEEKVKGYEAGLAQLDAEAEAHLKTIKGLLPGATSAGLAAAFNLRRAYFKWPLRIWQGTFIISVLGLLCIAFVEFGAAAKSGQPLSWDQLGLSLMHRLPFVLPLIWLAFHASHKAALAQRLEEDYAFKETVSASFEGYRREMRDMDAVSNPDSAASRLSTRVLAIVTDPPGRIYEKHRLNHTPLTALADSAGPITDAASKIVPSIPVKGKGQ